MDYILGSDEFNEYLHFSDGFAFFLDGVNIAQIGGTDVSIGSVNCGSSGVNQAGPNCANFVNNVRTM